jgi:hypothetical protein
VIGVIDRNVGEGRKPLALFLCLCAGGRLCA